MEAAIALSRLGGVATHAELVNACGRSALHRAIKAGLVRHGAVGCYFLPDADVSRRRAVELHGSLGLASAAMEHGWKVKTVPTRPTVYVAPNRRVSIQARRNIDLRWAPLSQEEKRSRVTDPTRTVIDCARFMACDEALAIADSALRSGQVGARELIDAAETSPRTGRGRAIRVASLATALADNPMESVLRAIATDIPGLQVVPQHWVTQHECVDLADPARRLVIEAESMEFHGTLSGYRRDVRRYTDFVRQGWLVLRFCWEDIMLRPDYVTATITDVLRDWRPPAFEREVRRASDEEAA